MSKTNWAEFPTSTLISEAQKYNLSKSKKRKELIAILTSYDLTKQQQEEKSVRKNVLKLEKEKIKKNKRKKSDNKTTKEKKKANDNNDDNKDNIDNKNDDDGDDDNDDDLATNEEDREVLDISASHVKDGYDFLLLCSKGSNSEVFQYLEYYSKSSPTTLNKLLNRIYSPYFDFNGAIHLACLNDNLALLKLLVRYGANIYMKNYETRQSVLHIASSSGYVDIIVYLLKYISSNNSKYNKLNWNNGERVDTKIFFDIKDKYDTTPLQMASNYFNYDCVDFLISHGADPFHKSRNYESTIDILNRQNNVKLFCAIRNGVQGFRFSVYQHFQMFPFEVWNIIVCFLFGIWEEQFNGLTSRMIHRLKDKIFII